MRCQLVVGVVAVLAAATVEAQPAQAPSPWYRLTLADGRTVDGQFVGGDAVSYYVQTVAGVFSIQRNQVIGMAPLGAPAPPQVMPPQPMPQPMVQPMVQPTPAAPAAAPAMPAQQDTKEAPRRSNVGAYFIGAGATYALTAVIARSRTDNDPDAKAGYIPILGPVLWTASDEGKWGEDGWDWLGLLVTAIQGGLVYRGIAEIGTDDPTPKKKNAKKAATVLSPAHGDDFRGIVFSGSF